MVTLGEEDDDLLPRIDIGFMSVVLPTDGDILATLPHGMRIRAGDYKIGSNGGGQEGDKGSDSEKLFVESKTDN